MPHAPVMWDVRPDPTDPTRLLLQFDEAAPVALTPTAVLKIMNALTSQVLVCLKKECAIAEAKR